MMNITKKSISLLFITIITLLAVFSTFTGVSISGASTDEEGIIATGRHRIKQPLQGYTATDLHFTVYQKEPNITILKWGINIGVPFTKMHAVPDDWPQSDGKVHSVSIDIEGIAVPYGTEADITAILRLSSDNTVRFANIKWTYANHEPVDVSPDMGWAVATIPGASSGGWLISKYNVRDLNGNQLATDLVGHQYLPSNAFPTAQDMSITNGAPGNPGKTPVLISDWGVANVPVLPPWEEIDNWQNWDKFISGPIVLNPGATVRFPDTIVIPTPDSLATPTPQATPTPVPGVIAADRRTIIQPLAGYTATDLHFTVYVDEPNYWIVDWGIELSVPSVVPFSSIPANPSRFRLQPRLRPQ